MMERIVSTDGGQQTRPAAQTSVRAFVMRHKPVSVGALAALVVIVAVVLPAIPWSGSRNVSDSSPCSTWSSANRSQQRAYARLYVREHGPLPTGATSPDSVESAITAGCTAAYAYDDADTVNVIQAIDGRY